MIVFLCGLIAELISLGALRCGLCEHLFIAARTYPNRKPDNRYNRNMIKTHLKTKNHKRNSKNFRIEALAELE